MENTKITAHTDWETEFYKVDELAKSLYDKLQKVEEKAKYLNEEILRYQTIIKTIEFALGRKLEV